jgi:hypothetical protein
MLSEHFATEHTIPSLLSHRPASTTEAHFYLPYNFTTYYLKLHFQSAFIFKRKYVNIGFLAPTLINILSADKCCYRVLQRHILQFPTISNNSVINARILR